MPKTGVREVLEEAMKHADRLTAIVVIGIGPEPGCFMLGNEMNDLERAYLAQRLQARVNRIIDGDDEE